MLPSVFVGQQDWEGSNHSSVCGLAFKSLWPSSLKVIFIQFLLLYEEKSLM